MLTGLNYRALVIDGVIISALAREHAHVVGDGENTIAALVDRANHDPRRSLVDDTPLFTIELNDEAEANLVALGYSKDTVPGDGEHVILRYFPSISRGGTAQDITDDIHPEVREVMLLGGQALGLGLAGGRLYYARYFEATGEGWRWVLRDQLSPGPVRAFRHRAARCCASFIQHAVSRRAATACSDHHYLRR